MPLMLLSACSMLIHLAYMLFFFLEGIYIMGCINIISVIFYSAGIFTFQKGKHNNTFLFLALFEIIIHAVLATLFTGWDFGFQMFIICMIPVPYMLTVRREINMFIMAVLNVALFVGLRISCCNYGFTLRNTEISVKPDRWYIFNSIVSFLIIIAVTFWFRFRNMELNQELAKQNAELQKAASLDSLTGLFNRRAMTEFIGQINTTKSPYCAIILDIDFFKNVNDTYGHSAGDMVLIRISEILKNTLPPEAFICRWGGEELLFLLPTIDKNAGAQVAEKVRTTIESENFIWENEPFTVTATFGVSFSDGTISPDDTIRKADDRLYLGKRSGRNTVVTSAA
ncbi:MAG: GGDEF domain-containing protein [Oscillospiraceae bacterium]